jgi:hypothetical protein
MGYLLQLQIRKAVVEFMNDPENGFELVPWFVCKSKIVTD